MPIFALGTAVEPLPRADAEPRARRRRRLRIRRWTVATAATIPASLCLAYLLANADAFPSLSFHRTTVIGGSSGSGSDEVTHPSSPLDRPLPPHQRRRCGHASGAVAFVASPPSWRRRIVGRAHDGAPRLLLAAAPGSNRGDDDLYPKNNGATLPPHTPSSIPRHVAFICDGNSRWASSRSLPSSAGHARGADRAVSILTHLRARGVRICTLYAFSTENWRRPSDEVNEVLSVMERTARAFRDKAVRDGTVRIRILGDLNDSRIPLGLRAALQDLERDTASAVAGCLGGEAGNNNGANGNGGDDALVVCLAINYGGRADVVQAVASLAASVEAGELRPSDINEELLESRLCTSGLPHPDLIVRTGGERRLSNFLLWNAAYSELYFTDDLWPDFDEQCVDDALSWYARRSRRFGGRNEGRLSNEHRTRIKQ